jgi:nitroreductase
VSGDTARDTAAVLMRERRSRPRLAAPAPGRAELAEMLVTACAAPDHGRLRPWRFVVLESAGLPALGEAYAAAHAERSPAATAAELARTRDKPLRAPMIVAVIGCPQPHPKIAEAEQVASAVCVAHGLLLAAHGAGYGAMWRSGWYGEAPKVRAHLGLLDHEQVVGWIYLGTPVGPAPAPRPEVELPVTWLG